MTSAGAMDETPPPGTPAPVIVFSDLDGTLLDRDDYSHDRALPALDLLDRHNIPLVLCTSKTRAEVQFHRRRLANRDPFVVENGGAVYVPEGYFPFPVDCDREDGGYRVIELGAPYQTLVGALVDLRNTTGVALRGFSDMSAGEVASLCGLPLDQAELAKQREYDEPFLIPDPDGAATVLDAAEIPITRGGRFYHASSSDKGRAVSLLIDLFRRSHPGARTIGIGDATNDLPLLEAVDIPVVMPGADDGYDPGVTAPRLRYAEAPGPAGWNAVITELVNAAAPAPPG
jgi:mannosyl-3-phosphoglycerate phosphatase